MSLSDLASLGSFVSGVAVLVSLVFLYFQLRQIGAQVAQAEKNQRASMRAERASRTIAIIQPLLEPSAAEAMYKGMAAEEHMSGTEVAQFSLFCLSRFHNLEDAFAQHAEGLLDETAFANLTANLRYTFSSQPGFRTAWNIHRNQFDVDGDFVAFVDGIAEVHAGVGPDVITRYREGFAAERAARSKPLRSADQ